MKIAAILDEVSAEAMRANAQHGTYASAHEGFAVLLEEVDELKEWVWKRREHRDPVAMRKEAVQIAACAIRFAACCEEGGAS